MSYDQGQQGGPALTAAPPVLLPNPNHELVLASKNYWAGHTGREDPPVPTYRKVHGRMRLGRYMDPYGCECHMRSAKRRWQKWYTGFLISAGAGLLFSEIDWVFWLVALPVLAIWYFSVKYVHYRQYRLYFHIQQRILASGQPEWVPYDWDRRRLLKRTPLAVWP